METNQDKASRVINLSELSFDKNTIAESLNITPAEEQEIEDITDELISHTNHVFASGEVAQGLLERLSPKQLSAFLVGALLQHVEETLEDHNDISEDEEDPENLKELHEELQLIKDRTLHLVKLAPELKRKEFLEKLNFNANAKSFGDLLEHLFGHRNEQPTSKVTGDIDDLPPFLQEYIRKHAEEGTHVHVIKAKI